MWLNILDREHFISACVHLVILVFIFCFQVTVNDTGVRGMIAVGLVPPSHKLEHQPGWLPHSVAFHADDGKYVMIIFLIFKICIIFLEVKKSSMQCSSRFIPV